VVRTGYLSIFQVKRNLSWVRLLVTGLLPWRPGFGHSSVNVKFVVDKVELGQIFLPVVTVSFLSIIPRVAHTHVHVGAVTKRANRRRPGTFKKENFLWEVGEHLTEKYFLLVLKVLLWLRLLVAVLSLQRPRFDRELVLCETHGGERWQ
jgi:hypothetical protein